MLFNSSVYISCHPVRLADKNCDVSVITLYGFLIFEKTDFYHYHLATLVNCSICTDEYTAQRELASVKEA